MCLDVLLHLANIISHDSQPTVIVFIIASKKSQNSRCNTPLTCVGVALVTSCEHPVGPAVVTRKHTILIHVEPGGRVGRALVLRCV